ncbi:MAG: hypothetical protein EOP06_19795 [Proteobacteria bacterium]|nr:MAG: hypothetical protein EOP06_19795 [Pseudomonadota bacterium]
MMDQKMMTITSILRNYLPMAQEDTLQQIATEVHDALGKVAPVVQIRRRTEYENITPKRPNGLSVKSI